MEAIPENTVPKGVPAGMVKVAIANGPKVLPDVTVWPKKFGLKGEKSKSLPLVPTPKISVAEIYERHGLDFLRALKKRLPFRSMDSWTTKSLLGHLDRIAPGFQRWADELEKGMKRV